MKAVFDALNIVYDEKEKRNFVWLNLHSLTFTPAHCSSSSSPLVGIVVVPIVLNFVGLSARDGMAHRARCAGRSFSLVGVLGLAVLYRYGPSRDTAQWRWVTLGQRRGRRRSGSSPRSCSPGTSRISAVQRDLRLAGRRRSAS